MSVHLEERWWEAQLLGWAYTWEVMQVLRITLGPDYKVATRTLTETTQYRYSTLALALAYTFLSLNCNCTPCTSVAQATHTDT